MSGYCARDGQIWCYYARHFREMEFSKMGQSTRNEARTVRGKDGILSPNSRKFRTPSQRSATPPVGRVAQRGVVHEQLVFKIIDNEEAPARGVPEAARAAVAHPILETRQPRGWQTIGSCSCCASRCQGRELLGLEGGRGVGDIEEEGGRGGLSQ